MTTRTAWLRPRVEDRLDSQDQAFTFAAVSGKSAKIAELIASCKGGDWDAHYLGYFECFNRTLYFEAHDVLEELWLADRDGPNYAFHKGLIQLAGSFVHLQKNRLKPAVALLDLAATNLGKYPDQHEGISLVELRRLIVTWRAAVLEGKWAVNPLTKKAAPKLSLPAPRKEIG